MIEKKNADKKPLIVPKEDKKTPIIVPKKKEPEIVEKKIKLKKWSDQKLMASRIKKKVRKNMVMNSFGAQAADNEDIWGLGNFKQAI